MSQEKRGREILGSLGALLGFSLLVSQRERELQERLPSPTLSSANPIKVDLIPVLVLILVLLSGS